jgi:hypothetical protein
MSGKVSQESWDVLVDAYRRRESHTLAAQLAGVDIKTAIKAFREGLRAFEGGTPIADLVAAEQMEARAALIREERLRREAAERVKADAREDAVQSFKEEGGIVRKAQRVSGKLLDAAVAMLGSAEKLGGRVQTKLDQMLFEDDQRSELGGKVTMCQACGRPSAAHLGQVVGLIGTLATHTGKILELAHKAMVMERLHLGRPTEIVGIEGDRGRVATTIEEGTQRIATAVRLVESAVRRGALAQQMPATDLTAPADESEQN